MYILFHGIFRFDSIRIDSHCGRSKCITHTHTNIIVIADSVILTQAKTNRYLIFLNGIHRSIYASLLIECDFNFGLFHFDYCKSPANQYNCIVDSPTTNVHTLYKWLCGLMSMIVSAWYAYCFQPANRNLCTDVCFSICIKCI